MTATSLFDSLTSIAIVDRSADVAFLMSISVPWCGLSEAYFPLFDGGCLTDKAHKYSDATDPHGEYFCGTYQIPFMYLALRIDRPHY